VIHRLASGFVEPTARREADATFGGQRPPLQLITCGRAAFIGIDKREHRFDFRSAGHSCLFLPPLKGFRDFVVPAALSHKLVPDVDLILRWLVSDCGTPMQDFVVTATLFHPMDELIIIHSQKSDALFIKTFSEIGLVIRIQLLLGVKADFI
jgi:hypothetical protein